MKSSVRRLVLGAARGLTFAVAGLTRDALGLPLVGNLLVEAIDDVLQLLSVAQPSSLSHTVPD
jgi:hypothetical protein